MVKKVTLASLHSHMPVEVGDVIRLPGDRYEGIIHSFDGDYVKVRYPKHAPEGRLETSKHGAGLVYMYDEHLRVRPAGDGPVDHGLHSIWNAMVAAQEAGTATAPADGDKA